MNSLHRRISLVFIATAVLMALLAAFSFLELLYLEHRAQQGLLINQLQAGVQDIRRAERNLFLYQDQRAGQEALQLAQQLGERLASAAILLDTLTSTPQQAALQAGISTYRENLQQYLQQPNPATPLLENRIREQGQRLSRAIGDLYTAERHDLQRAIAHTKWAQAIGVSILALLLIVVGRVLARSVVQPMKRLADDLNPIAEGQFDRLELHTGDAELLTLRQAFNRMLDELEARRRRLIQSEKLAALGVLVSGVAHELNNPLSNISSSCQLLLEEMDSAERELLKEWAETIDSETERARRIVAALLDFGRRREPQLEPVNLHRLLERTLLLLGGALRDGHTRVQLDIPAELQVMADSQRLQQVFINLIRNAAESGAADQVTISARPCLQPRSAFPADAVVIGELSCHTHAPTSAVELDITDNGVGMEAAMLPRVFEPFYTTREPGRGMGLGLYIVQEVIQEQQGCIAIRSQPQQGTQVLIRLPGTGAAT
ncbi:MAG: ATP-binding protein [Thiolinea sp.]